MMMEIWKHQINNNNSRLIIERTEHRSIKTNGNTIWEQAVHEISGSRI